MRSDGDGNNKSDKQSERSYFLERLVDKSMRMLNVEDLD